MSEDLNRALSMQELEEALRLDFDAPEDERPIEQILTEDGPDVTRLLEQTEVLAQAYKPLNITGKTARESIESHYRNTSSDEKVSAPGKTVRGSWFRRGMAIAAVVALLVGIPLAASAFNWEDLWNTVAKWAKETFSFVSDPETELTEPDKQDERRYTSLQDVLPTENGAHKLVPTWIPEGYVLEEIIVDESPMQRVYIAVYKSDEKTLKMCVQSFIDTDPEKIEIDENLLEIYEIAGAKYYILDNVNQTQVIWIKGSFECCISCELSIEEIKMMIDSILKG